MDPWSAGLILGGNLIGAASQPDQYAPAQPRTYTGLLNPEQIPASNQLLKMLMSGGGDFGSGAATSQANATLMKQLAAKGINPNSKFAASKQGDMLGNIAGQDASRRGSMLLQLLSQRGNPLNYQNMGYGYGGMPGWGEAGAGMERMQPMIDRLASNPLTADIARQMQEDAAARYRTGGTYQPQKVG